MPCIVSEVGRDACVDLLPLQQGKNDWGDFRMARRCCKTGGGCPTTPLVSSIDMFIV